MNMCYVDQFHDDFNEIHCYIKRRKKIVWILLCNDSTMSKEYENSLSLKSKIYKSFNQNKKCRF